MDKQPLVSIITVNYREPEVTCALLDSIRDNSYKNIEVVVVENAPLEDSKERFQEHYPGVKVLTNKENLGFAKGNNLGIREANGQYLFLVNNDTEFTDGLVENLLKRFQTSKVGMVGPKIRFFHQPDTIQFAGFTEVNPLTARNRTIGEGEKDEGQHNTAAEMPYVHGAAMMVSREVIEKTGGLPEPYFLYYEELDWCVQIRKEGYIIYYEPDGLIYHKESVSVGRISSRKTYYLTRNRILFMRRNASPLSYLGFLFFLTGITVPRWTLTYLFTGQWSHLKAFWKGVAWHFRL